jgi:hypothetical protein
MDDWAKQRLAELEAAAPIKRKKTEPLAHARCRRLHCDQLSKGDSLVVA